MSSGLSIADFRPIIGYTCGGTPDKRVLWPLKYGILFLLMSILLALEAALFRGGWWMLVWPAISFGLVGLGYLGVGARVFGKRPNGAMAWYCVAVLLPFLLLLWATWHLARQLSSEDCWNEVAPGLFVGRRPLSGEVPEGVKTIVDLTAEFPERCAVHNGREYIAAPMLDTGIADETFFKSLVCQILQCQGPIFIHCAQGHGRTGLVAAAVLIAKGLCTSPEAALATLQAARPRLGLGKDQQAFLRRICTCGIGDHARTQDG